MKIGKRLRRIQRKERTDTDKNGRKTKKVRNAKVILQVNLGAKNQCTRRPCDQL